MNSMLSKTLCLLWWLILIANGASIPMLQEDSLLTTLDRLSTGDNPEALNAYSAAIVKLTAADKLSAPFPSALAKRLAANELRVRRGKQARISELAVSMAFNRIADKVGFPRKVTVDNVHSFRILLSTHAPHLITVGEATDSCNPGEALFLIYVMIANNGTVQQFNTPDNLPKQGELLRPVVIPNDPHEMRVLIESFAKGKQDIELIRNLEDVLSLLRI